jgi:hypothetical protein
VFGWCFFYAGPFLAFFFGPRTERYEYEPDKASRHKVSGTWRISSCLRSPQTLLFFWFRLALNTPRDTTYNSTRDNSPREGHLLFRPGTSLLYRRLIQHHLVTASPSSTPNGGPQTRTASLVLVYRHARIGAVDSAWIPAFARLELQRRCERWTGISVYQVNCLELTRFVQA